MTIVTFFYLSDQSGFCGKNQQPEEYLHWLIHLKSHNKYNVIGGNIVKRKLPMLKIKSQV